MMPSAEPGKRLAECTGMNGCSAHQNDSKPSASTFRAMKPTSTKYAGSGTEIPTFIGASLSQPTGWTVLGRFQTRAREYPSPGMARGLTRGGFHGGSRCHLAV